MASSPDVAFTGQRELIASLKSVGIDLTRLVGKALYEEANEAFLLSQEVVPIQYGPLKASGRVSEPMYEGNTAKVEITYGGSSAPYAAYVHEIPPSRARHDPPTRWKYLENPVSLVAEGMAERMAVRVLDMLNEKFKK